VFLKFIRALLLLAALFGLLVMLAGLAATLSGTIIALPGLGLIVSGPFVLILGLLITLGALALYRLLGPRRTFR